VNESLSNQAEFYPQSALHPWEENILPKGDGDESSNDNQE
jgi:hypothetical protein